jgi:hypothetical protein
LANYQNSVDIANRALQHCGAGRIAAFTDDSKAAADVAFCYDKLREAELRRNVWVFSIRKAAVRPVDTTTTRLVPVAWATGTTYAAGAVVTSGGLLWESTAAGNVGNIPGLDASPWELYAGPLTIRAFTLNSDSTASDTAYYSGELVLSAGTVYRSIVSNNSDIPPTANWLSLGAASGVLSILYPVVSQSESLIVMRFAASVTRVPAMDPMFCEGLAARIGLEVCEDLTQSADKLKTIGSQYNLFMREAREVNGIEVGPVESPEDDYIVCRI